MSLLYRYFFASILIILGIVIVRLVNLTYNKYIQHEKISAQPIEIILPKLVLIPPGSFDMGDPDAVFIESLRNDEKKYFGVPNKHISFDQPFYMTQYEITHKEFTSYIRSQNLKNQSIDKHMSMPEANKSRDGNQPAVEVNWRTAMTYAAWLGEKKQLNCRLPTEAEWEYAARAGSTTAYPWGDQVGINNANCNTCGSQWDNLKSAPIGQFKANQFGLYDTSGNVWEWTCSKWQDLFEGQEQQCTRLEDFSTRSVRSGSWAYDPKYIRSSTRGEFDGSIRYNGFGFRVMCALTTEK